MKATAGLLNYPNSFKIYSSCCFPLFYKVFQNKGAGNHITNHESDSISSAFILLHFLYQSNGLQSFSQGLFIFILYFKFTIPHFSHHISLSSLLWIHNFSCHQCYCMCFCFCVCVYTFKYKLLSSYNITGAYVFRTEPLALENHVVCSLLGSYLSCFQIYSFSVVLWVGLGNCELFFL